MPVKCKRSCLKLQRNSAENSAVKSFLRSLFFDEFFNLVAKVDKKIETPVFQDHHVQ